MGSVTASTGISIGRNFNASQTNNGYMSNLRVVKGTAVYTSNFTPPTTPLTAIANTSLLLNVSNSGSMLLDSSSNRFAITNTGNVSWSSSYYPPSIDFGSAVNSGSLVIMGNTSTIIRTISPDTLVEGNETIILKIRTGSTSGTVVATANTVTVTDILVNPIWVSNASLGLVSSNPMRIQLSATSAVSNSITYSMTSGSLPSGVSLYSNGAVYGTLANTAEVSYSFTAVANDGYQNSDPKTFTFAFGAAMVATDPTGQVLKYYSNSSAILNQMGEWTLSIASGASATAKVWGAAGGAANGGPGGYATGTLPAINNAATYKVWVGGGGKVAANYFGSGQLGGFGGGGLCGYTNGPSASYVIGSGGGLSGIFLGVATFGNSILIAGGGGGGGATGGSGGGTTGGNGGASGLGGGGGGGSQVSGGGTGTSAGGFSTNPTAGGQLYGGDAASSINTTYSGGGGGGGYYGGGGGGANNYHGGAGGGGSGYINAAYVTNGSLSISSDGVNPPNTSDLSYNGSAGKPTLVNSVGSASGNGLVVINIL